MGLIKYRKLKGSSLADCVVATVVVVILVVGSAKYKYFAVRDAVRAERQLTAARTALLFCEAWHGTSGATTFDPVQRLSNILPISAGSGSYNPEGYNLLGSYDVVVDNQVQNVTLSWKDMSSHLRALNIVVTYCKNSLEADNLSNADGTFVLTTYCNK